MQLMKTEVMTNEDGALLSQKKQRQSSHLKGIPIVSTDPASFSTQGMSHNHGFPRREQDSAPKW